MRLGIGEWRLILDGFYLANSICLGMGFILPNSATNNIPTALRISEKIDFSVMEMIVNEIIRLQKTLRARIMT